MSKEKSASILHAMERTVVRRLLVHVPVEVTEIGGEGHPITERTFIEDVSDFGCRFSTRGPVKQGGTLSVKTLGRKGNKLPDEESRLYEIMWVAPKDLGYTIGARLIEGKEPANAKFPREIGESEHDPK